VSPPLKIDVDVIRLSAWNVAVNVDGALWEVDLVVGYMGDDGHGCIYVTGPSSERYATIYGTTDLPDDVLALVDHLPGNDWSPEGCEAAARWAVERAIAATRTGATS